MPTDLEKLNTEFENANTITELKNCLTKLENIAITTVKGKSGFERLFASDKKGMTGIKACLQQSGFKSWNNEQAAVVKCACSTLAIVLMKTDSVYITTSAKKIREGVKTCLGKFSKKKMSDSEEENKTLQKAYQELVKLRKVTVSALKKKGLPTVPLCLGVVKVETKKQSEQIKEKEKNEMTCEEAMKIVKMDLPSDEAHNDNDKQKDGLTDIQNKLYGLVGRGEQHRHEFLGPRRQLQERMRESFKKKIMKLGVGVEFNTVENDPVKQLRAMGVILRSKGYCKIKPCEFRDS